MNLLVEQVEKLLEEGNVETVAQMLTKENDDVNEEVKEYCWGRYYNVTGNYEEALKHFIIAKDFMSDSKSLYGEIAYANENLGKVNDAEQAYLKMYELESNPKYRWAIMSVLADFYKKHHMLLKLERIGKKLCQEYKTNYRGYHVLAIAKLERRQYKECEVILENVPDKLKRNPKYIEDLITCYEFQKKYIDIINILECNKEFVDQNKNYVLKKQIIAYSSLEKYDEAENCLFELVFEFCEIDAIICLAILMISKGDYDRAIAIGQLIKDNVREDEVVYIYYSKLILTIGRTLKYIETADDKKQEELRNAINGLITYLKKKNILADEVEEKLISMEETLK